MRESRELVGNGSGSGGRGVRLLLSVCVFVLSGCWQEVHYVPSAEPEPPPSEPVVLQTEQPAEIKPPAEKPFEAMPSADDLFAEEAGKTASRSGLAVASEAVKPAPASSPDPIAEEPKPAPDPALALAAWRLGSKWSLAVGIYGKGFDADRYGTVWKEAEREAGALDVTLPPLLDPVGFDRTEVATALLLEEGGPSLAAELGGRLSAQHQALCELATKTHVLLLIYTPESGDVKPLIAAIRQAGASSGLPSDTWMPLVGLLDVRADFADIKRAVFQLHKDAEAHLAEQAGP